VLLALLALAIVAVALAAPLLFRAAESWSSRRARGRSSRRRVERRELRDPGRERRAEQRARELLRSCVNDEEWGMYRDLGFIRVTGQLGRKGRRTTSVDEEPRRGAVKGDDTGEWDFVGDDGGRDSGGVRDHDRDLDEATLLDRPAGGLDRPANGLDRAANGLDGAPDGSDGLGGPSAPDEDTPRRAARRHPPRLPDNEPDTLQNRRRAYARRQRGPSANPDDAPYAYLIYPHKPIVAYVPKTGRLLSEYCVEFPDLTGAISQTRLPDSDDVLAKWMALTGDEERLIRNANMHLPGRQVDPGRVRRDLWRLSEWARQRRGHGPVRAPRT
jgi:hypothetical protein